MFTILEQSTPTCLAVHFSGRVSGDEYRQFLSAVGERRTEGTEINLVLDLTGIEVFDDLDAVKSDIKFGFGDYKHIRRSAFVGDQKWIGWFTRLVGPFTHAEEKQFPAGQTDEALNWACA